MKALTLAAFAVLAAALPARAQTSAGVQLLPGMGSYSHPIQTRSAEAQKYFDQGLVLLYNFNHAEAERSFLKAAELDPAAPMPWWGVGIALGLNYNRDVSKLEGERLTRAYDAAQKAVTLSRNGSPVEAALADALATRYSRDASADPEALNRRYREAMKQVVMKYPDDPDAATMYADAMMNLRPWQLWQADGTPAPDTLELVKILETVLRRYPDHPGANHYYVHAVEASPTPERALASATRLETLVPGAGHLVHMPTHIYIHTGQIDRVAELNKKAAAADEHYMQVAKPAGVYPFMYYGHNVHFVMVGSLLIGRYEDSLKAGQQMAELVRPHLDGMAPMVEWAVSLPTLTYVRFHKWDAILAAPRPAEGLALTRALDSYARAVALQMTGKRDEAKAEAAAFEQARARVPEDVMVASFNPAKTVLAMVSHLLQGQLAADVDAAIGHLEAAAAAQDQLKYDEPEPWPWSVRETLGSVLLKANRGAAAEKVFRVDLERNAGSGRALYGLMASLQQQGKTAEAVLVKREADAAWKQATSPLSVDALF